MASDQTLRQYLRRATNDLRAARQRLRDAEAGVREPIAVVGVGCRFPGGVERVEDLWRIAVDGVDATGGFPGDRGWVGPDGPLSGTGGFVATATGFDAAFFGVSSREARAMDPQQRLLLEVVWEAVERARLDAGTLRGRAVGVFVGVSPSEYGPRLHEAASAAGHVLTGTAPSIVAGRVAYTLGLGGPALSVDTACSSSLVAIHLAGRALRSGECELALAGGVSVLTTPGIFAEFDAQGGLAADGRCKPFSSAADGTGWAEGAGVVVLERLSDALANGHQVWAVIRGSAVNQDGASNGLTAPSGSAQQRVIATALADAGLSASDVDVVEAHGTGTRLGDPIEAAALADAYRPRPGGPPLWLGSVKSNIGHTQAAAGVAGLLKMIMAVRLGMLPGTLHACPASPHVDWDDGRLALLTETIRWPESDRPRRAGVSSFGISGTNAHLILEQPPEPVAAPAAAAGDEPWPNPMVWPVSAASAAALASAARRLRGHLDANPGWEPERIGYSLAATRAVFGHRAVVLGRTRAELLAGVDALREGSDGPRLVRGVAESGRPIAYVLPGHGSQHPGMGRELAERYPVFADALERVCALLDPQLPTPLRQIMFADPGTRDADLLDNTRYTHAAVFAYQTALCRLLESLGLTPDWLIGHSLGEITAAHLAGVLTLPDACALLAARGGLLASLPEGAMAAIHAGPDELATLVDGLAPVSVAAYNSPGVTVVSGDPAAIHAVVARVRDLGRRAVLLPVGHALHSPATHAILEEFLRTAASLAYHPAGLPVISTVTGEPAADGQLQDPAHWSDHIRKPVRFAQAVAHLGGAAPTATILEIAAVPTLGSHIRRCLGEDSTAHIASAGHPGQRQPESLLAALAHLHTRGGGTVRWERAHPGAGHPVDLPTYPFQRRYCWHPDAVTVARVGHPLAGRPIPLAQNESRWFGGTLAVDEPWFLAQHTLLGTPVLPASAMIEWALGALRSATGGAAGSQTLDQVTFLAPLPVVEGRPVSVQAMVEATEDGHRVRCFARPAGLPEAAWTEHVAVAHAAPGGPVRPPGVDLDCLRATLAQRDVDAVRRGWSHRGLDHGPAFHGLSRLFSGATEALALIEAGQAAEDGGTYTLHPVVVDACVQVAAVFLPEDGGAVWLPSGVRRVVVHNRPPSRVWCRVRWQGRRPAGECAMDLDLLSEAGQVLATMEEMRLRAVSPAALAQLGGARLACHEVRWRPVVAERSPVDRPAGTWLVSGPDVNLVGRWCAELAAAGVPAVAVRPVATGSADDVRRGLAEAARGAARLAGLVLHCGTPSPAGDPVEDGYRLTRHAFALLKEFLLAHGAQRPDVVVCLADGDLAHAAVGGLTRAVTAEYRDLRCVRVDLGPEAPALPELLDQVARLPGAGHLALRGGRWQEARLRLRELPPTAAVPVRADATYLITGGLGGLGLEVAGWLAGLGARCLLLVGRSLPAEEPPALAALRAAGVRVELRQVDVADQGRVADLLSAASGELPALRGVVHAAGVTADASLTWLGWERFAEVLDPKARGGWHLHRGTAGLDLDFFVLFSSVASMIGTAGQANYAAANAFLDALAGYRRDRGLPAVSVSWGPWAGVGMVARRDLADRLAAAGLSSVPAGVNLDALGRVLAGAASGAATPAHIGVASVDWRRVAAGRRMPDTVIADLLPVQPDRTAPIPRRPAGPDLARLAVRDPAAAREAVLAGLLQQLAPLLRLAPEDQEELRATAGHRHLSTMGLDSLTAVQLQNRILLDFAADIPPEFLFNGKTVVDVVESICEQLALRSVIALGDEPLEDGADTEILTL
ncbi:SDR family NAD(P)-dependent oxidoreductase [Solihabitans fulvus]|uniref:SDR family NAD(P)-dependent oxidoreductase n=1 Tax=Solihabitans fulvus TaxID=1892852 RepID=A0A5B2XS97_9PSEU|nr:type I polyketide synthase [Solihabitans fulvus]KAA2265764.1 SDR family NAD(P)-dependent oxidoreductase [Solihabitans fulvus]